VLVFYSFFILRLESCGHSKDWERKEYGNIGGTLAARDCEGALSSSDMQVLGTHVLQARWRGVTRGIHMEKTMLA